MNLLDCNYKVIKDDNNVFDLDEVREKITEYFREYDYIVGDYSYGKLRLKGFTKEGNRIHKAINDIKLLDKYISENCAYGCKYFVLEKIEE